MTPFERKISLSLKGLSVTLAIPVNRDFPWQTNLSLIRTVCALKDRRIEFDYQLLTNGSIIEVMRSRLAHTFLKGTTNRLFMIDSDQSWEPESFLRILGLTGQMAVVGATYPAKREGSIDFLMDYGGSELRANEFGCFEVGGMGLGFTCVQREVIEKLAENAPKIKDEKGEMIPMIFHCEVDGEVFRGEDMNFFSDCRTAGYKIHVDPSITMGHIGAKEYRGRMMDALRKA